MYRTVGLIYIIYGFDCAAVPTTGNSFRVLHSIIGVFLEEYYSLIKYVPRVSVGTKREKNLHLLCASI